jgi:methylated-DNA-[protein]-cysteine S-methyltransferase
MIPCHRVIASDLTLGGFMGEWGTESAAGSRCARKREMLVQEGVVFDTNGKLGKKEDVWKWD